MNITSAVVGISLMGTAMPMVANMTIQPLMAQKRAENFAVAESAAVGYAAKNEGGADLTPLPDNCSTAELECNSFTVTCWHGEGQFKQSVARSFRLAALCEDGNNGHSNDNGFDCSNPGSSNSRIVYTPSVFWPCGTHGESSTTTILTTFSASLFLTDLGLALTTVRCSGRSHITLAGTLM